VTITFFYVARTWEWMPDAELRSFFHPLLYAIPLQLLSFTVSLTAMWCSVTCACAHCKVLFVLQKCDSPRAVQMAPKLFQAALATAGDYSLKHFTRRRLGSGASDAVAIVSCLSWYSFYVLPRSFSSSVEASLSMVAFALWPQSRHELKNALSHGPTFLALVCAAGAVVARPSALLLWVFQMFAPSLAVY
jgi:hypothetical protein